MPHPIKHNTLRAYVPAPALDYCVELWNTYNFVFRISKARQTKLGDYRHNPTNGHHYISVNQDLNPYSFLITYVHEVAHCVTHQAFGRKVAPHGSEWKHNFQQLMEPLLNKETYPESVLSALTQHMRNPRASSYSDHQLIQALANFDKQPEQTLLSEIEIGKLFKFKRRTFQKEAVRRTRVVCKDMTNGKKYLISGIAPITPL